VEVAESGLRCSHCGRRVLETKQTRDRWRVDYYRLHGGEGEVSTMTERGGGLVSYIKVAHIVELLTCVDCYEDPEVQRQREEVFRPEALEEGGAP